MSANLHQKEHKNVKEKLSLAGKKAFRAFAVSFLSFLARVKFRASGHIEGGEIDEKAIVFCNHSTIWDFSFLLNTLKPRRVRFVATSIEFEKGRLYAWVLRTLGVIPKTQGAADAACVRSVMRACQSGEIVAIYPAGMTSHDGRPAWRVQPGTGKLARMTGASVYVALENGAFMSHPRYAFQTLRGRVEVSVRRLATAEEAKAMTAEELQTKIEQALYYNDWDWQAIHRVPYTPRSSVKGVTKTLYMCPDCKTIGGMEETNGGVRCRICQMSAARDEFGFFHAAQGFCPSRMDEWVDLELKRLKEEVSKPDFFLCAPVTLLRPTGKGVGYAAADEGELTLNADCLIFKGKIQNFSWTFQDFQYFVMNDVNFLHIYAVNGAFRFVFADPRLITRWFFAHRMLAGGEPIPQAAV